MKTNKKIFGIIFILLTLLFTGCGDSYDDSTTTNETTEEITSEVATSSDLSTDDWTDATHTKNVDPNFDELFVDNEVKRIDIVMTDTQWQSMLDNMTELYGEFGSTSTQGNGQAIEFVTPDDLADTPVNSVMPPLGGQFENVPTDEITTETTEEDPIFVAAEVFYEDLEWYKVGVRFKGNSSLKSAWEAGILKLSFKLDFDEFEDDYPEIKNQRFYGFKKLSLKNNYDDSSFLREKVASDVFKDAGLAVSHTAFYTVYVDHGNGAEYFGLYTLVEEVDDTLIDTQFSGDGEGNLYKPEDGSANFVENSFSSDDFEKKTNEDEEDWSDIQSLFTALHSDTRTADSETWRTNLEAIFDVDSFLKYLAVNGVIQNWDTYGRMIHNYYLHNNPENGKLTWIPWDNNEALQEGKLGGSLALNFSDLDANNWPLIEKIYADDTYKATYDSYVQEVIDGAFKTSDMQAKYETYKDLVEPYATTEIDGYTYLNNVNDFDTAIETLKTHVEDREAFANAYLEN